MTSRFLPTLIVIGVVCVTAACKTEDAGEAGDAGGDDVAAGGDDVDVSVFPGDLSFASPLEVGATTIAADVTHPYRRATTEAGETYDENLTEIKRILEGVTIGDCAFDPQSFHVNDRKSSCYGPRIDYTAHPDATPPPPSPPLPPLPLPPPGSPSLKAQSACTDGNPSVNLSWTAIPGATEYHVLRCSGVGCSVFGDVYAVPASPFSDNATLAPNTVYRYRIRAHDHATGQYGVDSTVSEVTTVATCNPAPPPPPPPILPPGSPGLTGPQFSCLAGAPRLTLQWSLIPGATEYRIGRCTGAECDDFSPRATTVERPFTDNDVASGQTYRYRMRAYDAVSGLTSEPSNAVVTYVAGVLALPDCPQPPPDNSNGTFPGGDLGIWDEYDSETGDACAAAQLKTMLEPVSRRIHASLTAAATLLCVANVHGLEVPSEEGGELDLTDQMNETVVFNNIPVTFDEAVIESAPGGSEFTYTLSFLYGSPGGDPRAGFVRLRHVPVDRENREYRGEVFFRMENDKGQLFGAAHNNCPATESTHAFTAAFENVTQSAFTDRLLLLESRVANYCGHDLGLEDIGFLDPADKRDTLDPAVNPDGWWKNYSIFRANYSPVTKTGDFIFAWQAGVTDDAARVFNLILNHDDGFNSSGAATAETTDEALNGDAFFGFGDDISVTDGSITKFICNWAGPGHDRTGVPWVQSQHIRFDETTERFESDATKLHIRYAPTNSCNSAGPPFVYDDITTAVQHELYNLINIPASGFVLPLPPETE